MALRQGGQEFEGRPIKMLTIFQPITGADSLDVYWLSVVSQAQPGTGCIVLQARILFGQSERQTLDETTTTTITTTAATTTSSIVLKACYPALTA